MVRTWQNQGSRSLRMTGDSYAGVSPDGDWVVMVEENEQAHAVTLRRIIGFTAPLIVGLVIATLLRRGPFQVGGNFNPMLALLLEVLVGVVGGWLIRSHGLALVVPVAYLAGIALAALLDTGTLIQGDPNEVVSLAVFVLIVLLSPTAVGAVIGAEIGNRTSRPDS